MSDYKSLSEVVLDALELHTSYKIPKINSPNSKVLVVASGNALPTGKIIFQDSNAVFADEGQYKSFLKDKSIKSSFVISASGEKHAPIILKDLIKSKLKPQLITCNSNSTAAKLLDKKDVIETKSNPEPVTYNTSTYLGMILSKTRENPEKILKSIKKIKVPSNLKKFKAIYLMIPPEFEFAREMFITKFDELFGPKLLGRCYTSEQTRHAKTVINSEDEIFISIGFKNNLFGSKKSRWDIPLSKSAGFAEIISKVYFIVGKLQEQNPQYFQKSYKTYEKFQKEKLFDKKFFEKNLKKFRI